MVNFGHTVNIVGPQDFSKTKGICWSVANLNFAVVFHSIAVIFLAFHFQTLRYIVLYFLFVYNLMNIYVNTVINDFYGITGHVCTSRSDIFRECRYASFEPVSLTVYDHHGLCTGVVTYVLNLYILPDKSRLCCCKFGIILFASRG
ncbi:unnamed protein product [Musa textilis]